MANEISKNSSPGNASPAPQQIPLAEISDLPGSTSTRVYTPKELGGLVSSIQSIGVREPIIVRRTEDGRYQLLAGQRRRRASELAKKATIPALVYEMTLQEALDYHKAQEINPMAVIPGKAAALSKPEGKQDTPAAHAALDKGKGAEKPTPAMTAKSEPAKTEDKQTVPAAPTAPDKRKDAEKPTPAASAKSEPAKSEDKQSAPAAPTAPNKDKDAEKPTPAASAKAEPVKTDDKQTAPAVHAAPNKDKDAEKPTPATPTKAEPVKAEDKQTAPAVHAAPDKGKDAEKPTPAASAKAEPAKTEDKQTVPAAPTAPDKRKDAEKPTPAASAKSEPAKSEDKQSAPAAPTAPNKDKDAEKPTPAASAKAEPVKTDDKQTAPAVHAAPNKDNDAEKPTPATPAKSEPAKAAAKAPSGPAAIGPTGTAITQVFEARLTPPSEKDLKELPVPKEGESYFITLHPAYLERSKFNNFSVDKNSENFKELRKAVEQAGIKDPVLARPREGGGLEILSGQRRHLIGTELNYPIPTIIQRIDDADAKILVADSNLHRDKISTYDLSRALKMKMEGMKQKAGRKKKGEVGERLNTDEALAREMGITVSKFNRMLRMSEASKDVCNKVDDGELALSIASALSFLKPENQDTAIRLSDLGYKLSTERVEYLKRVEKAHKLNESAMRKVLSGENILDPPKVVPEPIKQETSTPVPTQPSPQPSSPPAAAVSSPAPVIPPSPDVAVPPAHVVPSTPVTDPAAPTQEADPFKGKQERAESTKVILTGDRLRKYYPDVNMTPREIEEDIYGKLERCRQMDEKQKAKEVLFKKGGPVQQR